MWELSSKVHVRWNIAWFIFGDFNIIRYPCERLGCESFSPAMFAFSGFIENNYLVDLPLDGATYTWFRDVEPQAMSHIDRTSFCGMGGSFRECVSKGAPSCYF